MSRFSIIFSTILALGTALFANSVNAAPPLSTRDVAAHCGAELEAMAPGSAAKIKAMSDADFEKWDKADTTMQMINAPDMTPAILQDLIQSTRDDKWDPYDTSKEKSATQLAGDRFYICQWQLRLDQLNGKNVSSEKSRTTDISSKSTNTNGSLNQVQIDACSNDIKAMQVQSQSWPGDVNDVAARLGQYQKDMFEGRCAEHPEAQAYIASANRMLGNGGSTGATKNGKRSNVADANATHCLVPQKEGGVINNCNYAVEYNYCVVQPTPGSWAASFDCNQGKSGSWQVGPNSRAIMQTAGSQVAFFGCKYGPTLSNPDGISPADFRYNANGMPSGRCREWGAP